MSLQDDIREVAKSVEQSPAELAFERICSHIFVCEHDNEELRKTINKVAKEVIP